MKSSCVVQGIVGLSLLTGVVSGCTERIAPDPSLSPINPSSKQPQTTATLQRGDGSTPVPQTYAFPMLAAPGEYDVCVDHPGKYIAPERNGNTLNFNDMKPLFYGDIKGIEQSDPLQELDSEIGSDNEKISIIVIPVGFDDPKTQLREFRGLAKTFLRNNFGDFAAAHFLNVSLPFGIKNLGNFADLTDKDEMTVFASKFRAKYPDNALQFVFVLDTQEYIANAGDVAFLSYNNNNGNYAWAHEVGFHKILFMDDEYLGDYLQIHPANLASSSGMYTTTEASGFKLVEKVFGGTPPGRLVPTNFACQGFEIAWLSELPDGASIEKVEAQNLVRSRAYPNQVMADMIRKNVGIFDEFSRRWFLYVKKMFDENPAAFRGKY